MIFGIGALLGLTITAAVYVSARPAADAGSEVTRVSPRAIPRELKLANLPAPIEANLRRQAARAGVDGSDLAIAEGDGAEAGGGFSLVLGQGQDGSVRVAFVAPDGHSGFMEVRQLLRGNDPMFIAASKAGTRTVIHQVGLHGVVQGQVERVALDLRDGGTQDLVLTRWPDGKHASFAFVSNDRNSLPVSARAYGEGGKLLEEERLDSEPCGHDDWRRVDGCSRAGAKWLGRQGSNLESRAQNPLPYHFATPHLTVCSSLVRQPCTRGFAVVTPKAS